MRPILRSLVLVVPLLGLLTWLSLHSVGPLGQDYVYAQRDVARVSLAEAALRVDVLRARVGLLRDDDPLVRDIDALQTAGRELHRQAMVRTQDGVALDELLGRIDADADALEQFKTDNALLQNSLLYMNVLDTRITDGAFPAPLVAAVAALGDAVFHLDRNPSAEARDGMRRQLAVLATFVPADAEVVPGGDLSLLLRHGRLLLRLLPAVDNDLRRLLSISTEQARQVVRRSQDMRRLAEEARAAQFRIGLYLVATLLVVVLARVAMQWRAGLHQIRRRTEAEVRLSAISARLSFPSVQDFPGPLTAVLHGLGEVFEADRAYLLLDGLQPDTLIWTRPGAPAIEASLVPLLAAMDPVTRPATDVHRLAELCPGKLREAVLATGARAWCACQLFLDGRASGLLAFDTVRDVRPWPPVGFGLVGMAAEVVGNGIERHLAARQQAELEARLERGRRLETIGTFASGIAHNFNNVLGAMMGHAEMAAEAAPDAAVPSRHIAAIQQAGHRAQDLVSRILDFGSRRSDHRQVVAVAALLGGAEALLRPVLPRGVELAIETDAPGEIVEGDPAQLQQVLVNLGRNAAQAMPGGGRVVVAATAERLDEPISLSHGRLEPGRYVRVRVADSGTGMDAATLANLFRPFFTTKPAGTGLGLATAREIVHDHRGTIDVRSAARQGSVFAVWLPAQAPRPASTDAADVAASRTVLLIAPDRATALHDEDVVAALGYEPVGFDDLGDALVAAAATPDRFDVVLLNVLQLDGAALDAIGRLRIALADKPVILLTNDAPSRGAPLLTDMGIAGILGRPLQSRAAAALLSDACNPPRRRRVTEAGQTSTK